MAYYILPSGHKEKITSAQQRTFRTLPPVVGQFHVNSSGAAPLIDHTVNVKFKLPHYPTAIRLDKAWLIRPG
jgi:hypothetical protein